jgi:hypothetical protein
MVLAQRRQVVNLLASGMLAAVVGLIAVGLPALDRALPARRPVSGMPYLVGGGITVVPPPGSFVDVTRTRPGDDRGTALFLIGAVQYGVSVAPYAGDLTAAVGRLRQRITGTSGYQVTGPEQAVTTGSGIQGLQGGYTAPGRGGRYAAFVVSGSVIEVTVSADAVDVGRGLPGIESTTRSIRRRTAA